MASVLGILSWVIDNWQLIATAFSSVMSIALFFMHGNSRTQLQELRDFINSVHLSQNPQSAKQNAELQNPKV